jgi:hypothetical protein
MTLHRTLSWDAVVSVSAAAVGRGRQGAHSKRDRPAGTRAGRRTQPRPRRRGRQAFAALTGSPGARAFYDSLWARDIGHNDALRRLSNRLVGILQGCLRHHTTYDEATAWPSQHDQHQAA